MPVDSGRSKKFAGLGAEPLTCMNELRPGLTLINGDYNARLEADVAHMLEDIPAECVFQRIQPRIPVQTRPAFQFQPYHLFHCK